MTVQPPDGNLLDAVMARAQHDLDEHDLGRLFRMTALTWEAYAGEGHHRGRTAALALLFQGAKIRQRHLDSRLADYLDRCAEACLLAWCDEVAVQESLVELDDY